MSKQWIVSIFVVLLLSIITACGGSNEVSEGEKEEKVIQEEGTSEESQLTPEGGSNSEQPQMPEPDLDNIPDVVAEVNGDEITREEFESTYLGQFQKVATQSMMLGQEVDQDQLKKQIAESMVGQELLVQKANSSGIEATQEEIGETLDTLAQQNGLESKDEFMAAIKQQGMEEDELISLLESQVKLDKYIASELGEIKPTNKELQEAYETVVTQNEQMGSEEELPSFEEMKPDLEEQVKSQKETEGTQRIVQDLREEAEVTIYL